MSTINFNESSDDFVYVPTKRRRLPAHSDHASTSVERCTTATVSKNSGILDTMAKLNDGKRQRVPSSGVDEVPCPICAKDIGHLNDVRRLQHTNNCLDDSESKSKLVKEVDKWNNAVDCPMCKEPLLAGPHRVAHLKRCGNRHSVPARALVDLVETQTKIAKTKQRQGLPHTTAPKPTLNSVAPRAKRDTILPKTIMDEHMQLAKAISASESYTKGFLTENTIPETWRLPDQNSNGGAEMATDDVSQSLLLKAAQSIGLRLDIGPTATLKHSLLGVQKTTDKWSCAVSAWSERLEQLESLVTDLTRYLERSPSSGDVQVFVDSVHIATVHSQLIEARCPSLAEELKVNNDQKMIQMDGVSRSAVIAFLRYLYTGSVEFVEESDASTVAGLADRHKLPLLQKLCGLAPHVDPTVVGASEDIDSASVRQPVGELTSVRSDIALKGPQRDEQMNEDDGGILTKSFESEPASCSKTVTGSDDSSADMFGMDDDDRAEMAFLGSEDSPATKTFDFGTSAGEPLAVNFPDASSSTMITSPFQMLSSPMRTNQSVASDSTTKHFIQRSPAGSTPLSPCFEGVSFGSQHQLLQSPSTQLINRSRALLASEGQSCDPTVGHSPNLAASDGSVVVAEEEMNAYSFYDAQVDMGMFCHYENDYADERDDAMHIEQPCTSSVALSRISPPKQTSRRQSVSARKASPDKNPHPTRKPKKSMSFSDLFESTILLDADGEQLCTPNDVPKATQRLRRSKNAPFGDFRILKTDNITPMPNFKAMSTLELKAELGRYGVKALGKRKAIPLLEDIYETTHPVMPPSPRRLCFADNNDASHPNNGDIFGSDSQDDLEEDDIREESAFFDEEKESCEMTIGKKDAARLESEILSWWKLDAQKDLYYRQLMYEPIAFEEIHRRLSESKTNLRFSKNFLMDLLDKQHVTFYLEAAAGRKGNKRKQKHK